MQTKHWILVAGVYFIFAVNFLESLHRWNFKWWNHSMHILVWAMKNVQLPDKIVFAIPQTSNTFDKHGHWIGNIQIVQCAITRSAQRIENNVKFSFFPDSPVIWMKTKKTRFDPYVLKKHTHTQLWHRFC